MLQSTATSDKRNPAITATTEPANPAKPAREWSPHFWEGIDFFAWVRLLWHNRFAVHWSKLYVAYIVTHVSFVHTLLRWLQALIYGRRIRATELRAPPVFIVGHWRTGTTLLHELLILDPRHTFPNTYQCLEPNHPLLTEGLVKRYLWFLMPSRRPMDNMEAGWDKPQEDEFALCMMGQPSPYLTFAFPNNPPMDQDALTLQDVTPERRESWKAAFLYYLRMLTFKDPRRLILKSPTHSFRLPVLRELFPDARFVHIVRNPYAVYTSTLNLWRSLYETQGLQRPRFEGLEEHVLTTFNRLYESLEEGKKQVPSGCWHEVKYEDLIADPIGQMRQLYERLGLGEFDKAQPGIEAYLAAHKGYQTNRYPNLTPHQIELLGRRWGAVIERFGYAPPQG